MMIASTVEAAFTGIMSALLPERKVMGYESRTEEMGALAVVIEAAPEEVWLRGPDGKAQGFSVEISAHALGYVEDVNENEAAFREFAGEVRDALFSIDSNDIADALPEGWSVSQYVENETADRAEEGNYDRWAAAVDLYLIVPTAEGVDS